jgi:light-regulated signal transduction histidine kinase (bacteriophytochrome)
MQRDSVDLSALIETLADQLRLEQPERTVEFIIAPSIRVMGDSRLLTIAMENLLRNAWKFTGRTLHPVIEFGVTQHEGQSQYFIRDNGAGFDMMYANKLFTPFQRLHSTEAFPGTGIGLAIVQRIIRRHGGTVCAEGQPKKGATFFFTV